MVDLTIIKKISGGRKFNLELSKGKDTITINDFTDGFLNLHTLQYSFRRLLVKPDDLIPSGTPVAVSNNYKQETTFTLPYDINVKNVDYRNKTIAFSKQSDWRFFSGNFREKFISSLIWLEMRDPISGKSIDPHKQPTDIFISLFSVEPGDFSGYQGTLSEIAEKAVNVFNGLGWTDVKINVLAGSSQIKAKENIPSNVKVFVFPEVYPAPDPGIIFSQKIVPYGFKDSSVNHCLLDFVTLCKLYDLLKDNSFKDFTDLQIYNHPTAGKIRLPKWACINPFIEFSESDRIICGGLLTGSEGKSEFSMLPHQRSLTIIQNPDSREMLQFLRPGFDRDSISPLVASFYTPKSPRKVHAGLRGEVRMCINCNYCTDICPAGLDPSLLWKTGVLAASPDEAKELGLLRCMRCGLCSYVCPAKIELSNEIAIIQEKVNAEELK